MVIERAASSKDPWAPIGRVICHVTTQCNLACGYCSAAAPRAMGTAELMSQGTVRRIAESVFARTRRREVSWIFFGGEPLLAPVVWFRRAMESVRREAGRYGVPVSFGLQTNGTLIDREVADFCLEAGLRPSVTLDGPPHLHDRLRQDAARTLAGIGCLMERGIRPTILTVIGPHNARRIDEVADFLLAHGLWRCKFNLFHLAGRAGTHCQLCPEDVAEARWRILQRMLGGDDLYDVNTVRWMRLLAHCGASRPDEGIACGAARCGAGVCHVAVTPDGSIYPCDRSVGAPEWRLGHVDEVLPDEEQLRRVEAFHRSRADGPNCGRCVAARICYHCCTAYRATRENVTSLCRAHRLLWAEVAAERERIADWLARAPGTRDSRGGRAAPRVKIGELRKGGDASQAQVVPI